MFGRPARDQLVLQSKTALSDWPIFACNQTAIIMKELRLFTIAIWKLLTGGQPVMIMTDQVRENQQWQQGATDRDIADISFTKISGSTIKINNVFVLEVSGTTVSFGTNIGERNVTMWDITFSDPADVDNLCLITYKKVLK